MPNIVFVQLVVPNGAFVLNIVHVFVQLVVLFCVPNIVPVFVQLVVPNVVFVQLVVPNVVFVLNIVRVFVQLVVPNVVNVFARNPI